MISQKVKMLLLSDNKKQKDVANEYRMSKQSISRKFSSESFFASDLIKIANLCDAELCFITKSGEKIYLTLEDLTK